MITFLKKYANDSFEKLVNEIHWMDLPFRLKAIFSKLPSGGGDSRPYKVYTALLTQSGTDVPTAIVLENTLGDITYGYIGDGQYAIISNNLFVENKVYLSIQGSNDGDTSTITTLSSLYNIDNSTLSLITTNVTGARDNSSLNNSSIEIRVYN